MISKGTPHEEVFSRSLASLSSQTELLSATLVGRPDTSRNCPPQQGHMGLFVALALLSLDLWSVPELQLAQV